MATVGVLGAIAIFIDGERPAHERLGLLKAVGGLEQQGQVVEVGGDPGVLGTEALLVDGERPAQ